MAFDAKKIAKISIVAPPDAVSPSLSVWHYKEAVTLAAMSAAGYFNNHRKFLAPGDTILLQGSDGYRFVTVGAVPVTGNVTVTQASRRTVGGQQTTVTASDTVDTGLSVVVAAVAMLEDAPALTCNQAQAVIGTQAGAPASGSIYIKTWKPTAANDVTPLAATVFGKKVNWIAYGY